MYAPSGGGLRCHSDIRRISDRGYAVSALIARWRSSLRQTEASLCGWTQNCSHDNSAAQIAARPEPLHHCVAGLRPPNAALSPKRAGRFGHRRLARTKRGEGHSCARGRLWQRRWQWRRRRNGRRLRGSGHTGAHVSIGRRYTTSCWWRGLGDVVAGPVITDTRSPQPRHALQQRHQDDERQDGPLFDRHYSLPTFDAHTVLSSAGGVGVSLTGADLLARRCRELR
jgi:hypothetical protein